MPGRSYTSSTGYRYGFNGMEKDDEVRGSGNAYDFGGRSIYDPRLSRFISIDPRYREYPGTSPYAFAANNPIYFIDKDGEGPWSWVKRTAEKFGNFFSGNGFRADYEVKKMKNDMAIDKEHTFLIKQELYRAQSFALAGLQYTPKSELELYTMARYSVLGDDANYGGQLKAWTPDMYQEIEIYLDAPATGYEDAMMKATVGVLYEIPNAPYSVVTGETLGEHTLTTPKEKMDALVDIIPVSKLMAPLKAIDAVVDVSKGLKGLAKFNDFSKKTKGIFKGDGHQVNRGFGFRKNNTTLEAVDQGAKNVGNVEDAGTVVNETKDGKDEK